MVIGKTRAALGAAALIVLGAALGVLALGALTAGPEGRQAAPAATTTTTTAAPLPPPAFDGCGATADWAVAEQSRMLDSSASAFRIRVLSVGERTEIEAGAGCVVDVEYARDDGDSWTSRLVVCDDSIWGAAAPFSNGAGSWHSSLISDRLQPLPPAEWHDCGAPPPEPPDACGPPADWAMESRQAKADGGGGRRRDRPHTHRPRRRVRADNPKHLARVHDAKWADGGLCQQGVVSHAGLRLQALGRGRASRQPLRRLPAAADLTFRPRRSRGLCRPAGFSGLCPCGVWRPPGRGAGGRPGFRGRGRPGACQRLGGGRGPARGSGACGAAGVSGSAAPCRTAGGGITFANAGFV